MNTDLLLRLAELLLPAAVSYVSVRVSIAVAMEKADAALKAAEAAHARIDRILQP